MKVSPAILITAIVLAFEGKISEGGRKPQRIDGFENYNGGIGGHAQDGNDDSRIFPGCRAGVPENHLVSLVAGSGDEIAADSDNKIGAGLAIVEDEGSTGRQIIDRGECGTVKRPEGKREIARGVIDHGA